MMRSYPDEPIQCAAPPPDTIEDDEGRSIDIAVCGEGPVNDELERTVEMYVRFDLEDRAQGIPPSGEPAIREWLSNILSAEAVNVLAWHDERVVGHATLVPDGQGAYELAIFVQNEYQGAGIGSALTDALLGQGRAEGVEYVWLTVERWNNPAIHLYRKFGFEESDPEGFELEMTARLA